MKKLIVYASIVMFLSLIGCGEKSPKPPEQEPTKKLSETHAKLAADVSIISGVLAPKALSVLQKTVGIEGEVPEGEEIDKLEKLKTLTANIKSALEDQQCITFALDETAIILTVDFDKCNIEGLNISGKMIVTLEYKDGIITFKFKIENLIIDELDPLNGELTLSRKAMGEWGAEADLEYGSVKVNFSGTVKIDSSSITLNASGSVTKDNETYQLEITDLIWVFKDCYPSSGTIVLVLGDVKITIEFDANTPKTGKIKVTAKYGDIIVTETVDLPSYNDCPPANE